MLVVGQASRESLTSCAAPAEMLLLDATGSRQQPGISIAIPSRKEVCITELNFEWYRGSSTLYGALTVLDGVAERPTATMLHAFRADISITRLLDPTCSYSYTC